MQNAFTAFHNLLTLPALRTSTQSDFIEKLKMNIALNQLSLHKHCYILLHQLSLLQFVCSDFVIVFTSCAALHSHTVHLLGS